MTKTLIARWESQRKAHWLELYKDDLGFTYSGVNCGGNLGACTLEKALERMERQVTDLVIDGFNLKRVL